MKSALVLIDLQNDYFPGGAMELTGMTQAAAQAREVLFACRQARRPIFHIQHLALGPDAAFFQPNTVGGEIHESLRPLPGEALIQKHYPNAFRETGLLEALKNAGAEEVIICGAMSHMCIDATTRAAFDFGFRCTVIHDACATRDLVFEGLTIPAAQVHGAFMAALGMRYARVISNEDFLSGLL
jgi:nicotinamidase-related amidase